MESVTLLNKTKFGELRKLFGFFTAVELSFKSWNSWSEVISSTEMSWPNYKICIKHFGAPALGGDGKYDINEASYSLLLTCPSVSCRTANLILQNRPFPDWHTVSEIAQPGYDGIQTLRQMFGLEVDPKLEFTILQDSYGNKTLTSTEKNGNITRINRPSSGGLIKW